jgi:hypothetical protein
MFQQGRRDDQLRDILNTMMALKQYKDESAWKEREWQSGVDDTAWKRGQEERRTIATESQARSLVNQRAEEPEKFQIGRELVRQGKFPDLGAALMFLSGNRTVDEDIRLARAKDRLTGGADRPNAQFDPALNYQKQLTDLGNFLETSVSNLRAQSGAIGKKAYLDENDRADMKSIGDEIGILMKRMNKARSLASRFSAFLNKPPDTALVQEATDFLGGIEPGARAGGGSPSLYGAGDWLKSILGGPAVSFGVDGGNQPATAPTPPAVAETPQLEPGTRRRNKKTGEVQIWTGTAWQTTQRK